MEIFGIVLGDVSATTLYYMAVFLPALVGIFLGAVSKSPKIANVVASLCFISCLVGASSYFLHVYGIDLTLKFRISSAIGEYAFSVDRLTSIMLSFSSVIFALIVVHVVKSVSDSGCRYSALLNTLFLACFMCFTSDSVFTLLISWEMITLTTFLLSRNGNNEQERWMFFLVAHVGGMLLICAYGYMAYVSGTTVLSDWKGLSAVLGNGTSVVLILMILMGFGSKLGLVPFHAWMPNLYSTAPIHTAALLSTVCSNVAILVLFKSIFVYIGVTEAMSSAALVIIAIAVITALWGAMESLVQKDPKKILAYSSMENMALVVICMGLGMIYLPWSLAFGKLVLIAALLHTLNHSVFKSLMLMSIDTVEDCTGVKNIGNMGGLAKTLPVLAAVALVGVISMAAIPPTNGFVSEWLIIQSLMGADLDSKGLSLLIPLILAAVGICGMMMAASYARLYGFIFLGRPRSESMGNPKPMKKGTVLPMVLLALLCLGMGIFAAVFMEILSYGITDTTGLPGSPGYRDVLFERYLPFIVGISAIAIVLVLGLIFRDKHRNVRYGPTWGCGGELGENMQYSSIGFSQPLVKVFHPFYGDTTVIQAEGEDRKTVKVEFVEPFVRYLYKPLGNLFSYISERTGRIQTGNIQTYFAYILVTLVVVLLAVRLL